MSVKYIRNVTDEFSLFDSIRKYTDQNNRRYLVEGTRAIINSPKIQEHMKLRELLGFFGHTKRQIYAEANRNDFRLPESAILVIDGKPVDVVNIPSNVTIDVQVSDEGIVTHTEQILDNPMGNIVNDLIDAKVGGWSWVTRGRDGAVSSISDFGGFDYVYGENFISLDKKDALMLEASGNKHQQLIETLTAKNITPENALAIVNYLEQSARDNLMFESSILVPQKNMELMVLHTKNIQLEKRLSELELSLNETKEKSDNDKLMLEKANSSKERFKRVVDSLPFFLNKEQKEKIISPQNDDDVEEAKLILESVMNKNLSDLPMDGKRQSLGNVRVNKGLEDTIPEPLFRVMDSETGF